MLMPQNMFTTPEPFHVCLNCAFSPGGSEALSFEHLYTFFRHRDLVLLWLSQPATHGNIFRAVCSTVVNLCCLEVGVDPLGLKTLL